METAVIPQSESNSCFTYRVDGLFGIAFVERERLLAKNVFSRLCRGDYLGGVHQERSKAHNSLNGRIFTQSFKSLGEPQLVCSANSLASAETVRVVPATKR